MVNSGVFLWNDAAMNPDEVLKLELNRNPIKILGYKCDELILTHKTSLQKYYFSFKLKTKKNLENHKFGNWYDFISKHNALSLKSIIENGLFSLESTAAMKFESLFFPPPANSTTLKSPYGMVNAGLPPGGSFKKESQPINNCINTIYFPEFFNTFLKRMLVIGQINLNRSKATKP